ncbi:MAG: hypothetical protein H0W88_01415 [Parachlamydiaceae bacterium]|nr:hypothetical protein [Parachlamydiaceae bacterium]
MTLGTVMNYDPSQLHLIEKGYLVTDQGDTLLDNCEGVAKALVSNPDLQSLWASLFECGYSPKSIEGALKNHKKLKVLNFRVTVDSDCCPREISEATLAISSALKINRVLQRLTIDCLKFGDQGCIFLAQALDVNTSLKWLELPRNNIGDEGCIALTQTLNRNGSLQILNLRCNKISSKGAVALGDVLSRKHHLLAVDLSSNNIKEDGGIAIGAGLSKNKSLRILSLNHNQIGNKGSTAIAKGLAENQSLKELQMDNCEICSEGSLALAAALKTNQFLRSFSLKFNKLDENFGVQFAATLKSNLSQVDFNDLDNLNKYLNFIFSVDDKESHKRLSLESNSKLEHKKAISPIKKDGSASGALPSLLYDDSDDDNSDIKPQYSSGPLKKKKEPKDGDVIVKDRLGEDGFVKTSSKKNSDSVKKTATHTSQSHEEDLLDGEGYMFELED